MIIAAASRLMINIMVMAMMKMILVVAMVMVMVMVMMVVVVRMRTTSDGEGDRHDDGNHRMCLAENLCHNITDFMMMAFAVGRVWCAGSGRFGLGVFGLRLQ